MSVEFSSLCNTDRDLYLQYLSKFPDVSTGQQFAWDSGRHAIGGLAAGGRRLLEQDVGEDGFVGTVGECQGFCRSGESTVCGGFVGSVGCGCSHGEKTSVDEKVDGEVGCGSGQVREQVRGEVGGQCQSGGAAVGSSECDPVVIGEVKCASLPFLGKKKMGKNQRDRAKYRRSIETANWREPAKDVDMKSDLRVSLEKKWAAQNELAAEKARKDLEYQKARDVDAEARKSRARLMKETESSKVATEKAFAFLKSTGNVAGFCETVVSDGSSPGLTDGSSSGGSVPGCTISPDSSASMHEFREAQKKIADQEFQIKKLTRQLALGKLSAGEEAAFTIHSDGGVSDDVKEAIAKCKNDFFDVDTNDDGFEDEKPRTLFAKRVAIPGADEYLYDNY